jgi:hypothetical protein
MALLAAASLAPTDPSLFAPVAQDVATPRWQVEMRVAAPATTTDPQHVGVALGVGRAGAIRIGARFQPQETSLVGFLHAALGVRLHTSARWTIALDAEHSHVWAARRLYRVNGFQLEGHDRRQLSLGVVSAMASQARWFGVVDGVEVGAGRMHIRRLVAGRAGSAALNDSLVPILESEAPVGMVGLRLSHSLPLGFLGQARARLIGAGNSPGGEVPFAHGTVEWDVTREIFRSSKYGTGRLGLAGNHATNPRAASYYQNGIGATLKIVF